jgi:hypothetical protein
MEGEFKKLLKDMLEKETKKKKFNIFGDYVQPKTEIIGALEYDPSTDRERMMKKYDYYARKYKIPLLIEGKKRTMKEIASDIHKYEMKNIKKLMRQGIDINTKEIGMYII